jgi:hypothetical protein
MRVCAIDLRLLLLDGVGNWKAGNYVSDGSAKGTQYDITRLSDGNKAGNV